MKRFDSKHLLNDISICLLTWLILLLAVVFVCVKNTKHQHVYNYIELKHQYKNYIIVEKQDVGVYELFLCSPLEKDGKHKVCVKDYIYFNWFVGDTIK